MDALYKYVRAAHVAHILEQARFRIGTLYEYRDIEAHGRIVGDTNEGRQLTKLEVPSGAIFSMQEDRPEARFFRDHIARQDQRDKDVKIHMASGAAIIASAQSQNYYLYCTSASFDQNAMEGFGYNACIRIDEPSAFFRALSHSIRYRGRFLALSAVTYRSRETSYLKPHTIHPALIKEPEYQFQGEVRALWEPLKNNPVPFVAHCRKAAKFCSLVRL